MNIAEAKRRIVAACNPERDWLKEHAADALDRARLVGYEDGVRDAISALSNPRRKKPEDTQRPT